MLKDIIIIPDIMINAESEMTISKGRTTAKKNDKIPAVGEAVPEISHQALGIVKALPARS
jgi:hypothetical protein